MRSLSKWYFHQSPWIQFQTRKRVIIAIWLLLFGIGLLGTNVERGIPLLIRETLPHWNFDVYAAVAILCSIVVLLYWRLDYFGILLMISPALLYVAFGIAGWMSDRVGLQAISFHVVVILDITNDMWTIARHERTP